MRFYFFLLVALLGLTLVLAAARMIVRRLRGTGEKPSIILATVLFLSGALLMTPFVLIFIYFWIYFGRVAETEEESSKGRRAVPTATGISK